LGSNACNADEKFEDVKRDVCNNAVDPYYSSPFPPNSMDFGKVPMCIHSNHRGHLIKFAG